MDNPPPCAIITPEAETKPIESKTFNIKSDKNREFIILLENNGVILNLSTDSKDKNSFQKKIYKNKFTLIDIQKVKLFNAYDSIDECLSEIEITKGFIREKYDSLDLVVPLNSKKYPEIVFPLLLKKISDSEKIQELYDIIHKINEEKNKLQKRVEELEKNLYHEIILKTKEEEPKGISINLSFYGKEDFEKYTDKNLDIEIDKNDMGCFIFFCNLKDNSKVNDLQKIINIKNKGINNDNKTKAKILDNKRFSLSSVMPSEGNKENNEEVEYLKILVKLLQNVRLIFKTDLQIKELFELKNFNDFFNKVIKCNLILKGITLEFKLFLMNLIDFYVMNNKTKNINLTKLLLGLKLCLSLRESIIPEPKTFFNEFKEILNKELNQKQELDKLILSIPLILLNEIKSKQINEELFKLLDVNNFSLICQFNNLNVGFCLKASIKDFSEVINNIL